LYVSEVFGDEGPKLKRSRPVSRGSAHPVWKRTSHITLTLNELKPTPRKKLKKANQEKDEAPTETIKEESVKEIDLSKKQDKPRFERKGIKSQKNQGAINRIFRRKAF
jgi:large subunit ribosomal protein L22